MRLIRGMLWVVAFWAMSLPAAAVTISLTVNGTTYDVLFTQGSYNSVNANPATPLTTTPWFGNALFASAFAQALQAVDVSGGGAVVPDASALYLFTNNETPTGQQGAYYAGTSVPIFSFLGTLGSSRNATTAFDSTVYFAYAPMPAGPAAVPEIDGNALAKALFLLFTLYVWLQVRRMRRSA